MARNLTQEDLAELKINIAKFRADGDRYFGLFDKHIPTGLPVDSEVLLYKIGNLTVISRIIEKNPTAAYCVYDRECVCVGIQALKPDANIQATFIDGPDKYDIFENREMKFDLIIMNPAYDRNLHLKILAEAIAHLKDEKSRCVNLSPVRWLQDPLAKYKKTSDLKRFEESILMHVENLDIVTALEAQQIFQGTIMTIDLGIYKCKNSKTIFNYAYYSGNSIINKCIDYIVKHNPKIEANQQDGWRVRMPKILGGKSGGSGDRSKFIKYRTFGKLLVFKDGKSKDGKWWYDCYVRNQHSKITPYITSSIKFNSEIEAINFTKQFDTVFGKYITDKLLSDVHVTPMQVMWLGDAINPRTGLKGYLGPWTDEDLYEYFGITEEERKIIEDAIAKYK